MSFALENQLKELEEQLAQQKEKLDCAVKALEEIKYADKIPISCPDNRKGCAVAHYTLGDYGKIARLALEEIKQSQ